MGFCWLYDCLESLSDIDCLWDPTRLQGERPIWDFSGPRGDRSLFLANRDQSGWSVGASSIDWCYLTTPLIWRLFFNLGVAGDRYPSQHFDEKVHVLNCIRSPFGSTDPVHFWERL